MLKREAKTTFSGCRTTQPVSAAGNGKRQKTAEGINIGRQPVAAAGNGKKRRRSSDQATCNKREKRRPQKVLAQFESAVPPRCKNLPFFGKAFLFPNRHGSADKTFSDITFYLKTSSFYDKL